MLFWFSACAQMFLSDGIAWSTTFDGEEAFIWICFSVATADRFIVLRTNPCTSFECKVGETPFDWHDKHVFTAVFLTHVTFWLVELAVTATHIAGLILVELIAIYIAELCFWTVLQWNWNNAKSTSLLFHFTSVDVNISIGCTNRSWLVVVVSAIAAFMIFETRAWTDVSDLDSSSVEMEEEEEFRLVSWYYIIYRKFTQFDTHKHVARDRSHSLL